MGQATHVGQAPDLSRRSRTGSGFAQPVHVSGPLNLLNSAGNQAIQRALGPSPVLQRQCACGGSCPKCGEEAGRLQRSGESAAASEVAPPAVHDVLSSSGRPLDRSARSLMEPRFAQDFSKVRIHTDSDAAQSAGAVGAHAYTVGNHIVFGPGRYAPQSPAGRRLIAHELAHVVQQKGTPSLHTRGDAIPLDASGETAAESASENVMAGRSAGPVGETGRPALHRQLMRGPMPIPRGPVPIPKPTPLPAPVPLPAPPIPVPAPAPTPFLPPLADPLPPVFPMPSPDAQPNPTPEPRPAPDEERKPDPDCGSVDMPLTHVEFFPGPMGQGGRVKASPLTKCPGNTVGSPPDGRIYRREFDCIAAAGQTHSWVRAHILHGRTSSSGPYNLHGPGDDIRNLIITDKSLNGSMRTGAEGPAITLVYGSNLPIWYDSRVDSYVPGLDSFGQSITIDYGMYFPRLRQEGPRLGGGTFTLKRTPPYCPTTSSDMLAAPAGAPAQSPGTPTQQLEFASTLKVCREELLSRNFEVNQGGVMVRIEADWFNPEGDTSLDASSCPSRNFEVVLVRQQDNWIDPDMGEQTVPVGQAMLVPFAWVRPGTYYIAIRSDHDDPSCCLTGDIMVTTHYLRDPHEPMPDFA